MLTPENLPELLDALGFEKIGDVYRKMFPDAILEVNLIDKTISYPEAAGLVVHERQTCNFDANENFVVLECVHRLLSKGYKPEHIELEPKWKLGRGASGGRADILIKDNNGRPLLIIECKTAGNEFQRAWNKTMQDGDQLFSYAQQISETQFLCLYASDFDAGAVSYTSHIIAHRDNDKYLKDKQIVRSFKSATDVKERFTVWSDTYKQDFTTKGIFENNIQAYLIGKDKYGLEDLNAISATDQQKKYHEFATILRQHNVSGRENAFDKLVNLFLCKLVDEIQNPSDLKFYWKGVAYDTHFDLMDRLQQLYQAGMEKFLGEEITYINQADVNNAMRFIRKDPDSTQRQVWELFIRQKFFTNNDFSFINVHNQKLFYQNAEVLLKILQMWQDIRLTNPENHNQFLGDMFEGFLDQGVKQSEGQFFTPMPICRFVLMSLPLASMVQRSSTPPKAIDYACGAGHFLNELALQIKPLVAAYKPGIHLDNYHKALFGIEKEYRLSKVAKVSAFMYGQQDINICYGDALVRQHAAFPGIQDGTFDVLVANPPYSVSGFLETLPESERQAYTLTQTFKDLETASSIETFFIERAQQLLRADGVAAIILPSSILSNSSSAYIRTREILLQYFDIVAVAELGSGTFGKTGTNTVTLFLRRKKTAPDTAVHYRERVQTWFKGHSTDSHTTGIYQDETLMAQYAAHIQVPLDDYKSLLQNNANGPWEQHEHFEVYKTRFNDSTEIGNLYKAKWFKALTETEQEAEINRRYLAFVRAIEQDKIYHFVMASDQPNPVLIVRSPSDTKEQKRFLGYEWSSAKGNEGIKITKNSQGHHVTPLYDETNRDNAEKINTLIAANFNGTLTEIPLVLQGVARIVKLTNLFDFSREDFEKQISLAKKVDSLATSKYPIENLGNLNFLLRRGKSAKYGASNIQIIKSGQARGNLIFDFTERFYVEEGFVLDERQLQPGDILINSTGKGTAGRVTYFDLPGNYVADSHITIFRVNERLNSKFGFYSLVRIGFKELEALAAGSSGQIELTLDTIRQIKIPVPPMEVQQEIVNECEVIDNFQIEAKNNIVKIKQSIAKLIDQSRSFSMKKLGFIASRVSDIIDLQMQVKDSLVFYVGLENIESQTGLLVNFGMTPCSEIKSVKTRFQSGDVLYGKLRPNLNKVYLAEESGVCSTDILVFRFASLMEAKFYKIYFISELFNNEVLRGVSGQQLPRTSWGYMQNIYVPDAPPSALEDFVVKIEALEHDIAAAQALIDSAPARKQAILTKYL